ncbi:MAG: PadR family transcriptional regulator [Chloroflexi bacterium]|nr:PadR family transcriptional regulator [Anaerolineaceae bacterium]NMB86971.1 PadR family transcriptional regulator [Chloroflexota bacterium]
MSVRLVILGLLHERPLYGYEIKQVIEEHMGDWTAIAFGSIYFALDKLAEETFIEKVATEQQGSRPSRSVYQITAAGREEFTRLLRQGWQEIDRQYFELDLCLFFLNALPRPEVLGYLRGRVHRLEHTLHYLGEHRQEQMSNAEVPRLAETIFDHSHAHLQAELEWSRRLLVSLENGEYD